MNIGLYVSKFDNHNQLDSATNIIDYGLKNNLADDASLFYDNMEYSDIVPECGLFHCTDMWNFTGNLIVYTLEDLVKSINIINKFQLYFLYHKKDYKINVLPLLNILSKYKVDIMAHDEESANEIFRITNNNPVAIYNDDPENIYKCMGAT